MLVGHAAELEKAETIDALWTGVVETLATAGFDHVVYLSVDSDFDSPFVRCTVDGLYDKTPAKEDPFLHHACHNYEILLIGVEFMESHPYISEADRTFIKRASDKGFRAGLAIPMRLKGSERFGGFLLGNGLDRTSFQDRILPRAEELRLFCMIVHRRIEELVSADISETAPQPRTALVSGALPSAFDVLSPRESEVIVMLAQGRTRAQTAEVCGLSIHTVSDYAKQGYKKLGVRNRAQAAALLHQSKGAT